MSYGEIRVAAVVGTRPEAIKIAPIIRSLSSRTGIRTYLISTGQHRSQLDQVFSFFGLTPDVDLELMGVTKNLNELSSKVLGELDVLLESMAPDMLLVQGDTTTAFAGALAAFHRQIPVGHVEAGLRSGDVMNPYPEEINRKLISTFATLNFAPTCRARQNLLSEGVSPSSIIVTGNTVVDALNGISNRITKLPEEVARVARSSNRLVLVTAHRRESWGKPLENICASLNKIVGAHDDVEIVFPMHKNPRVREVLFRCLSKHKRVHLIEPLNYFDFISTMKHSTLILSDSGGVQEEAPTFGVPVLVMRKTTERPEALSTNRSKLVGTNTVEIVTQASNYLENNQKSEEIVLNGNPFGDGQASKRIANAIIAWDNGKVPYLSDQESFDFTDSEIPNVEGY